MSARTGGPASLLRDGFAPEGDRWALPTPADGAISSIATPWAFAWYIYDNAHELTKMAERTPPDAQPTLSRLAMSSQSSVINLSAKFGGRQARGAAAAQTRRLS